MAFELREIDQAGTCTGDGVVRIKASLIYYIQYRY
jgi:hypothetical protein